MERTPIATARPRSLYIYEMFRFFVAPTTISADGPADRPVPSRENRG